MFWKEKRHVHLQVVISREHHAAEAANDDCFWMSILGSADPFAAVAKMQQLRQQYLDSTELLIEDRLRLIEACDVFLDLFAAVCVEKNMQRAASLAPVLNRHVPELMRRCPINELRPTQQQLDDVLIWYGVNDVTG